MNKKFSTLAASLMLASAFSFHAQADNDLLRGVKSGEYVVLNVGGKALTVGTQGELTNGSTLDALKTTVEGANADGFAAAYKALNKALWRVEVVEQTSATGKLPNLYRFVNKETGEYLALKLKTNTTNYTTDGVAKLDATGNTLWSAEGGTLSAYVPNATAGKDSTFFLNAALHLASKQGVGTGDAVAIEKDDLSNDVLTLKAVGFNGIMAYNGSNGKLNFNNGKDVTSNETNVLKDTKWKAVQFSAGNTSFALTDGTKKTDGKSDILNDKNEFTTVEKLNYLQVDTTYHNEKDGYFVLVKDTLPYEYTTADTKYFGHKGTHVKPAARRNAAAAEFTGEFWIANDSIALRAVSVPVPLTIQNVITNPGTLIKYVGTDENYVNDYNAAILAAAPNAVLVNALNALLTKYGTFKQAGNNTTNVVSFSAGVGSEIAAVNAADLEGSLTTFMTAVNNVKWTANTVTASTVADPKNDDYNGAKEALTNAANEKVETTAAITLANAARSAFKNVQYKDAWTEGGLTFQAAYFNKDNGSYSETSSAETLTGAQILTAISTKADAEGIGTSAAAQISAYTACFDGLMFPKATIAERAQWTGLTPEDIAAAQEAASHEQLRNAIAQLDDKYEDFIALPLPQAGGKSFATDNATLIQTVNTLKTESMAAVVNYVTKLSAVNISAPSMENQPSKYFTNGTDPLGTTNIGVNGRIVLRKLGSSTVLTLANDADDDDAKKLVEAGYIVPMIQPYATAGGDATGIVTSAKIYNLQVKNVGAHSALRATNKETNQYLVATSATKAALVENVDASNVYAQWAFIPGTAGYYTIQNRATKYVYYAGPVSIVKDADGKSVADTYVLGADTLKIAGVTLNEDNFVTENKVQYDYSGTYYTGKLDGITQSYTINPVSPFLSTLSAQMNKDSVMVLGDAEDGLVWHIAKDGDPEVYGLEIAGLPQLKKEYYNIYTIDGDDNEYYVQEDATNHVYILKNKTTDNGVGKAKFEIRNVAEGQYNLISTGGKMTINATPAKPILELSDVTDEKNDLFALNKTQLNKYRKLTAEDGVLGNAKIYMENEPNRYLYENTANIVANNGNKIAKDSLNFLGIYNTAAMEKNAALFVDTAYVEREGVYMPQYMFALGVTDVPAHEAIACTYEHNHFDNAGNKVDAEHCSHATPATLGYKAGRYLVALTDSIKGVSKHPGRYDGETRLAFVEAIHRNAEDALIIKNSKYTDTKEAANDTLKIEDNKTKAMTFALEIADQSTQSFYLATSGDKYVRILNGVPVLTGKKDDAAIFNIEATEENATANEAIEAAGVQVIGGQGVVTVQGAAGKVITVANILGQTIANQVAASDNVTIAAPAGIVVVAVEGDATKVVVK